MIKKNKRMEKDIINVIIKTSTVKQYSLNAGDAVKNIIIFVHQNAFRKK